MNSLLPPNATEFERNLSLASSEHYENLEFPNQYLWNADQCPEKLLDYLAWSIGVDSWNSSWSEAEKRAVIKANFSVHSIKGTKQALINALKPLNFDLKIVEWFEDLPQGEPYTFSVEITSSNKSFSALIMNELETIINNAKNVRSHLTAIKVVSSSKLIYKTALATISGETISIMPKSNN
ncbi:phage tail protein I [Lentisphaerota bacterium WC36G]|nr:phage tail protein I [Lentisphaerae bacterium WC36]